MSADARVVYEVRATSKRDQDFAGRHLFKGSSFTYGPVELLSHARLIADEEFKGKGWDDVHVIKVTTVTERKRVDA